MQIALLFRGFLLGRIKGINMAKAPAFQFYAADFLTDTAEMTDQEVGVYIRLLSHQWINGSLHSDPNRLANGVAIGVLQVWDEIEHKFPLDNDNRRRNKRLEETRKQQQDYRDKQSEAGREGAKKRWAKDNKLIGKTNGDPNGDPNGENIALQSSTSSSTSSSTTSSVDNADKKPKTKRFQKPSLAEVTEYCLERNNHVDPNKWIDHYTANGWKVGKNPMKDWKAAVRTWEKNCTSSQSPQQSDEEILRNLAEVDLPAGQGSMIDGECEVIE